LALERIFEFSTFPLRMWLYVGILISLTTLAYACRIIIKKVVIGIEITGYASIIVTVLLIGGAQLFTAGLLGEYPGRIFIETKGRPLYIVRKAYSDEDAVASEPKLKAPAASVDN
jgi:polyisoprenyl-phosphate glycosyltransferase